MIESDRQLFLKLLELDPVHQGLATSFEQEYDELVRMCDLVGSTLSTKDKIFFAFLWSDEEPRDLIKETPEPHELQEGDSVFVTNWTKENLARLGTVVDVAGLSDKGKIRVAIRGDNKKYREIEAENVHYISR